jgi:hypothetical protein
MACNGDSAGPGSASLVNQFYAMRLSQHAITLSTIPPYDTFTVSAIPVTANGDRIATNDTVVYTTNDTSVTVDQHGKIRVHTTEDVTWYAAVIATMTIGGPSGVTAADTAYVHVLKYNTAAEIPTVKKLSLQQPDSAATSQTDPYGTTMYNAFFLATAFDASDQPIPNAQVFYYTHPNTVFTEYSDGSMYATGVGRAMLYANAVIFGTYVEDSLMVTIGYKTQKIIDVNLVNSKISGFPPDTIFLGLGGSVVWHNALVGIAHDSMDVQFTGPAAPQPLSSDISGYYTGADGYTYYFTATADGGGDIAPFTALPSDMDDNTGESAKGRRFTVAGTYTYHSRFFPGTGIITVVPNTALR